ncbi:MAG TPA: sugar ABC transporter permease [Chloroflexia bacterium]|nr:sugar ABC transporter permease [Chloroflexia bacterium]
MSTMLNDPRLITTESGSGGVLGGLRRRLANADLGTLPIILGLVVIWAIFQMANANFLSPVNLTNLLLQNVSMGTMSVGIILVLLLGDIDLSVGAVSGLSAAVMAVLNVKSGMPGPLAVLAGLGVGLAIGVLQGVWITKLRVPPFIVTLAGFLGWQGALLFVLGGTGTVNLRDKFIVGLTSTFWLPPVGWIVGGLFIVIYGGVALWGRQQRLAAGLSAPSRQVIAVQLVLVAAGILGVIAVLNADRGLPAALVLFIGLIIVFDLLTRRTAFGRHVYAVGGNAEAARRASIPVDRIRIAVFALCSTLAAAGGILGGSRLLAVNQSSGSGDLLLNAIAAAVIGGTSLFGGRGSVWAALLGVLVIGSISNGMDLLALESPIKYMITGLVLLLAVTLDALTRRRRQAVGR